MSWRTASRVHRQGNVPEIHGRRGNPRGPGKPRGVEMETKTLDIQKLLSDYVDDLNVAVESRRVPALRAEVVRGPQCMLSFKHETQGIENAKTLLTHLLPINFEGPRARCSSSRTRSRTAGSTPGDSSGWVRAEAHLRPAGDAVRRPDADLGDLDQVRSGQAEVDEHPARRRLGSAGSSARSPTRSTSSSAGTRTSSSPGARTTSS